MKRKKKRGAARRGPPGATTRRLSPKKMSQALAEAHAKEAPWCHHPPTHCPVCRANLADELDRKLRGWQRLWHGTLALLESQEPLAYRRLLAARAWHGLVGYSLATAIRPDHGPTGTRLSEIALPHVREFMKKLLAKPLSPNTVGKVLMLLKEMLKHAVQWGYLDTNPAQYAEGPRCENPEMEVLTPEEIRRLLAHAEEPLRTLLLCAVLTGMRRGELLGLKWEDIDLEGHRLFVRRALWRGKFVTPKSRRSRRTIDMAPTLRDALARLPSRFRGGLVFCSEGGTALDPDNLMHRDFPRALRRAGVRRICFHDLRHTYTTLLIAQGAHPKYIQVQLGHASIQTTLDRYGHLMPDAHAAEARKLDQLVFGDAVRDKGRSDAVQREQNGSRNDEGVSASER
jgi:integrase